ncbi:gluconokinase [Dyella sp. KRB-257]|uniref:gluconokinase n=1 Tax=Dyella sp. KRB-257 TaxID=3400915 RepID=UPI003C038A92
MTAAAGNPVVVVMGVSGSGKSSFGAALADALHARFLDADDLHPPVNRRKMAAGIALDDADRQPWLDAVAIWMAKRSEQGEPGVVACSALRRRYRDRLRASGGEVRFVYLRVPEAELRRRMEHRMHFMPPALLRSQLDTLEDPSGEPDVLTLDGTRPLADSVAHTMAWLDMGKPSGELSAHPR